MPKDRTPDLPDTPSVPSGSRTVVQQSPPQWGSGEDAGASATHSEPPGSASAGRYELRDEIARGGMGVVYRAYDRVLKREVGIKTLLQVPQEGSVIASRFQR